MARKEGKKAKGAGARALASVAVTLRVTTTPAALNAPLQGASIRHSGCATVGKGDRCGISPDIPAGFVAVFNSDEASWHLVEDHRGKTVYDVASGDALFISELGPLPENFTWLSPGGEYQKWNGTAWVKDTEAEKLFRIREAEETKKSLMQVASEHIAPLQDAADLEIATKEETSLLEAWKKYRVLLNRVDTSTAPDIEWPAVPVME